MNTETNRSVVNSTITITSIASSLLIQYLYITFAATVLLANIVIGFVLTRSREFLKKSAFMTGLAVGDTMLGIGTVIAGVFRIGFLQDNSIGYPVHPLLCLKRFTTLLIIGVQLPSLMILLMSAERVAAVVFFSWYYQNWNARKAWYMVLAGIAFCNVSILSCWAIVYSLPDNATTPMMCGTGTAVGPVYSSYHFYLAASCGVASACSTVFSLVIFMNKRKKFQVNANDQMKKYVKKEWQITISTTVVAVLDLALVVVPNILISITTFYPSLQIVAQLSTLLLCLRSTSNVFIYLIFNRDFRDKLLFCNSRSSVHPISKSTNVNTTMV